MMSVDLDGKRIIIKIKISLRSSRIPGRKHGNVKVHRWTGICIGRGRTHPRATSWEITISEYKILIMNAGVYCISICSQLYSSFNLNDNFNNVRTLSIIFLTKFYWWHKLRQSKVRSQNTKHFYSIQFK